MSHVVEPLSLRDRTLHDIGKLALVALVAVPVYLLLNQYWQSLIRLVALYAILALFCIRLGEMMHRRFQRLPAEIPPWHASPLKTPVYPWIEQRFGAAEAIRSALQDPQYVQMVLKPRLQRLLMHRLQGTPEATLEGLDAHQRAQVDPELLAFLQRREPIGLWARFGCRGQRLSDVNDSLRQLEAL
ncbi:MAG TPA: hypothetical protein VI542_24485 [Candidatus Tectomicrobia bacterium]